ncbi:MAG: hypothetical protein GX575_10525 [Candidatus Anammoximicrobium sp.]|nr:hypothetical protein [Candidatus Anammoximicrobium sp.]
MTHPLLPVEIVLAPDWWHRHAGICFDPDFFFHPARRMEDERKMERVLSERWGRCGLSADADTDVPLVGATHLAAGYLLSEMMGCRVEYLESAPPQVIPAGLDRPQTDPKAAFHSDAFRRFQTMREQLRSRYGRLAGDVNWNGVLNLALDLRGQDLYLDFIDQPEQVAAFFRDIAAVIDRFTDSIQRETGTSSISVNRTVRFFERPVYLHSECSLTMISVEDYERFLLPFDLAWSARHEMFGIHYCGRDPHRYAQAFAKIPNLRFLDAGWGGDLRVLRRHLPDTFLNIRLGPVDLVQMTPDEIRAVVHRLVADAGGPANAGLCCINLDATVRDEQIAAIFEAAEEIRRAYREGNLAVPLADETS